MQGRRGPKAIIWWLLPHLLLTIGFLANSWLKVQGEESPVKIRIQFPSEVEIKGPEILLGECATLEGPPEVIAPLRTLSLGKAALPGQSRRLNRGSVLIRLRQAGLAPDIVWLEMPEEVQVKTRGQSVDREKLLQAIQEEVLRCLPYHEVSVKLQLLSQPVVSLPAGEVRLQPRLDEAAVRRAASAGTASIPVDILVDGEKITSIRVRVELRVEGPVLVSPLDQERRTILTPERIQVEKREWTFLPPDVLHAPEEAVGLRLTRTVRAGEVLTGTTVEEIPVIEKGQMLVLKVEKEGLLLTVVVKALEDGFLNRPLRVENPESGRVITAMLVGPREAVVENW